jgi:hypothetical protein
MVINKKAVKQIIKENNKQLGKDFLGALDKFVTTAVLKIVNNSKNVRLQPEDIE